MIKKKNALLLIFATMLLTACGGGSGGTPSSTTTGKVVDGYVENASVFCDTDDNGGAPDLGEEVVITDSQGNFTFSRACTGNIVASGGTDIATGLPLKSVFIAPPGSSVVTVVTTLLTGTLTNAQVAAFVGLPAGTNLLTLDPAATNSDGSLQNPSLMQRTLAIQQVVQQIMNTVGTLGHDSTTPTLQAISTEVGNAVISVAASNPSTSLIDTSGSVSTSLVNSIVQHAISNVSASSNSALSTLKATIGTFSPISVANAASTAISVEAQALATASTRTR